MTIEQRKIELINWITNLDNEAVLQRMEELREISINDLPNEIVSLLELSNKTRKEDLIEHTSSKDILNNNG